MKRTTDTLLPLGEKGRDEGMPPPNGAFARMHSVGAGRRVSTMRDLQSLGRLNHPLTPAPHPANAARSQGERGVR